MAQISSCVNIFDEEYNRVIKMEKHTLLTLVERGMPAQVLSAEIIGIAKHAEMAEADWRYPIVKYLYESLGNHEKGYTLPGSVVPALSKRALPKMV